VGNTGILRADRPPRNPTSSGSGGLCPRFPLTSPHTPAPPVPSPAGASRPVTSLPVTNPGTSPFVAPAVLLYRALEPSVSSERLAAFDKGTLEGGKPDPERVILTRYAYNVALCEALYPLMHMLEVTLRNAVWRGVATRHPGSGALDANGFLDCWLDGDPKQRPVVLREVHQRQVAEAKADITKDGRQVTEGRLIAELRLGFWTGLFGSGYGKVSPSDPRLWPSLFAEVFPHLDEAVWNRAKVADRLNHLRLLRNRAFHHEPIWSRKLKKDEANILEVLGWISPEAQAYARTLSRVSTVVQQSLVPYEQAMKSVPSTLYPLATLLAASATATPSLLQTPSAP
jgi:hypothetical protein